MDKTKTNGLFIPDWILADKELGCRAKLLLAKIKQLDKDKGCFASNAYLAKALGLSNKRISELITFLIRKGYVSRSYKKMEQANKRILKLKTFNHVQPNNQTNIRRKTGANDISFNELV